MMMIMTNTIIMLQHELNSPTTTSLSSHDRAPEPTECCILSSKKGHIIIIITSVDQMGISWNRLCQCVWMCVITSNKDRLATTTTLDRSEIEIHWRRRRRLPFTWSPVIWSSPLNWSPVIWVTSLFSLYPYLQYGRSGSPFSLFCVNHCVFQGWIVEREQILWGADTKVAWCAQIHFSNARCYNIHQALCKGKTTQLSGHILLSPCHTGVQSIQSI